MQLGDNPQLASAASAVGTLPRSFPSGRLILATPSGAQAKIALLSSLFSCIHASRMTKSVNGMAWLSAVSATLLRLVAWIRNLCHLQIV